MMRATVARPAPPAKAPPRSMMAPATDRGGLALVAFIRSIDLDDIIATVAFSGGAWIVVRVVIAAIERATPTLTHLMEFAR